MAGILILNGSLRCLKEKSQWTNLLSVYFKIGKMQQSSSRKFGEGTIGKQSCKIILKLGQLLERDVISFFVILSSVSHFVFGIEIFTEGHPMTICPNLFSNRASRGTIL